MHWNISSPIKREHCWSSRVCNLRKHDPAEFPTRTLRRSIDFNTNTIAAALYEKVGGATSVYASAGSSRWPYKTYQPTLIPVSKWCWRMRGHAVGYVLVFKDWPTTRLEISFRGEFDLEYLFLVEKSFQWVIWQASLFNYPMQRMILIESNVRNLFSLHKFFDYAWTTVLVSAVNKSHRMTNSRDAFLVSLH